MGFTDKLRDTLDKMWTGFMKTISVLVGSIFMIFSLGTIYGFAVATHPGMPLWTLMIPPLLGVLGYYYRTLAFTTFLGFLILGFLLL